MIIQNNEIFSLGSFTGTYNQLPVGTYRLRQSEKTKEYYLIKIDDFKLPKRIYGNTSHEERILNTFKHQERNLGCLFLGERGSGKTLSCKSICIKANLPVIIIDAGFDDVDFISFISNPELGSCIIFIDEFDKIYLEDRNVDESTILQVLDGAANYKHLFLLTANSADNLHNALINRPSRIFYRKIYDTVPDETIEEILENELLNKDWKEEMIKVFDQFNTVTYDIVMSLIKEVNLYNESPLKCAKLMNFCSDELYVKVIQVFKDGTERFIRNRHFNILESIELDIYNSSDWDSDYVWKSFLPNKIKQINKNLWEINEGEIKIRLERTSKINLLF